MLYTCKKCGRDNLLADEMNQSSHYSSPECKKCYNKYQNEYRRNYRKTENGKKYFTKKMIRQKYGLTMEEYELMLKEQLNGCAICKREFSDKLGPNVDHHHGSRKVRGILCRACNAALANVHEDEDIIWNMLEYLKRTMWSIEQGDENVATVQ